MSAGFGSLSRDDQVEVRRWLRIQRLALESCPPPRRPRWPWVLALIAFLLGVVAGGKLHAAEPPAVSLIVRPQVMLQRGDIRVEVRVPPHADNRVLSIAWSSDRGTAGSTLRPLEGEDAAILHTLVLPSQPAANYLFVASVFAAGGRLRGRTDARILVPDDGTPEGGAQFTRSPVPFRSIR